jgi:hypothetical protein
VRDETRRPHYGKRENLPAINGNSGREDRGSLGKMVENSRVLKLTGRVPSSRIKTLLNRTIFYPFPSPTIKDDSSFYTNNGTFLPNSTTARIRLLSGSRVKTPSPEAGRRYY